MTASRPVPAPRPGRRQPNLRPGLTILAITIIAGGATLLLRPPRAAFEPSPSPVVVDSPSPTPSSPFPTPSSPSPTPSSPLPAPSSSPTPGSSPTG